MGSSYATFVKLFANIFTDTYAEIRVLSAKRYVRM